MANFHTMYAPPMSTTSQLPVLFHPMQDAMHHPTYEYMQLQDPNPLVNVAMYKCEHPGCDRQFNRKYTLTEHHKTHTGEKPHVCPVKSCAKSFSTSGNLSRHKRLHGYIEPLQCPMQGCVCTFPSNNKLVKHMKFHFGNEDVKVCLVTGCGKTFSTTGNLNRHMKAVHSDVKLPSVHTSVTSQYSPTGLDQWTPKQYSPTGPNQWTPKQQKPRTAGSFEPDGFRPCAPMAYAPIVIVSAAWGIEELDALAGLFETPDLAASAPQVDSHTIDMFRHSLHFEFRQ